MLPMFVFWDCMGFFVAGESLLDIDRPRVPCLLAGRGKRRGLFPRFLLDSFSDGVGEVFMASYVCLSLSVGLCLSVCVSVLLSLIVCPCF